MKNNLFVKMVEVDVIVSSFSANDGSIIFYIKQRLKKISKFLQFRTVFVTNL